MNQSVLNNLAYIGGILLVVVIVGIWWVSTGPSDPMKYLPKLSLRDLLWLIVVVALSVVLWMDRQKLAILERELQTAQQELVRERAITLDERSLRSLIRSRHLLTLERPESQDSNHASE